MPVRSWRWWETTAPASRRLPRSSAARSSLTRGRSSFWDQPVAIQSITHAHELGLYTVYQDLAQAPDLTVAENFYLGRELYRGGPVGRLGVLDRTSHGG